MKRLLSVLSLLAAGGAWYLVNVDRRSARALDLVQLQGDLPVPIWAALAVVGVALFGLGGRPKVRDSVARPRRARASTPQATPQATPVTEDSGWYQSAVARAAERGWEQGVHVAWSPLPGVDVMLVLQSATQARVKRSVRAFAGFLSELPRPRRVRIQLRQCDTDGLDVTRDVEAAVHTFWPRSHLKVLRTGDDVDVLFSQPEPGWPG